MKEVLEYTEEELRNLSTAELEVLAQQAEALEGLWNTSQLVAKTLMNSLYGAMANKWFPLFNEQMAAAITGNGRYFIQKLAFYIEETLQQMIKNDKPYVIAGDTDSVYYQIEPFMDLYQKKNPGLSINEYVNWADNFEKKVIQPVIQRAIDDVARDLNAYNKSVIGAEREIISDAAVFVAKKKYFARVRDSEGTRYPDDEPYIKITGLEIIRSSTPKWAQIHLKKSIPHILDKDEADLKNWINEIKKQYTRTNLNDLAMVGSASRIDYELTDKGIPIASRAVICYNNYIKENNLVDRYAPIQAGDKAKRIFLTEPNPFNSNIVSFNNENFIKELEQYIDFDTNFEKGFLNPMGLMVAPLNYNLKKETETLDEW